MVHQAVILGGVATVTAFASLLMSYKASKQTKIKVRGFVFLLNKLKSKKPDDAALQKLFEPVDKLWAEVLEQER